MSNRDLTPSVAPSTDNGSEDPSLGLDLKARVVLVTGDDAIATQLEEPLRNAGHQVSVIREGRAALQELRSRGAELVMLDLVLPDVQGLEICRALRSDRSTRGFPFSIREVLLRVRVLLRPRPVAKTAPVLRVGALSLDARSHRAWVEKDEITLSVREFRLLEALMTRRDRVLPRQALLEIVWGGADVGARSVDAYITRLRRKLGAARDYVETVSSVGYRLKSPTE